MSRPNFLLFYADDLGWGDLGSYGHPTSSTPALDQLAQTGLRLSQFYTASSECSPSRAALLTGRYPVRNGAWSNESNSVTNEACGLNNHNDSLLKCNDQVYAEDRGLPLSERTLADLLSAAGYRTGACGKWNLGETLPHLPVARGFDSYFGNPMTNIDCASDANPRPQRPCIWLHNATAVAQGYMLPLRNTIDDLYVADATRFMAAAIKARQPFFYYFASQHVHSPQFAPDVSPQGSQLWSTHLARAPVSQQIHVRVPRATGPSRLDAAWALW